MAQSTHAQQVSQGMKEYWRRPGVKQRRREAAKRRRRIAFLQRQIAGMTRNATEEEAQRTFGERLDQYRAELQALLDQ